jgi:glycosidase
MRVPHLAVQLGLALTLGLSLSSCNTPVAQVANPNNLNGGQNSVEVAALTNLKVHFKNTSSWSKVNIHYWNTTASPTLAATTWPGLTMTAETGGWYSYTLPGASASNLLFVNGNTPTQKTPDLFRSNAEGWYVNGVWSNTNPDVVTPPGAGFTVHVKKPATWGGANVHYWNTVANPAIPASTWPGTPMTLEGCGWYKYNFANASSTNLLFVDPNNTAQKTIDMSRNVDGWYDNGTWGTTNPLPTGALGNPSTLTSSANTGGGTLNWTAPSDCRATGIKVYSKASSASTYTLASSLPTSATSYVATGLTGGTAYDFKVVSVDGSNAESTGATTTLTPPSCGTGAPSDITGLASTDSSNTAFLNWTPSSDCRTLGYKIYSKTSSASTYTLLTSSALAKNVGNYTAAGLTNGTVYNFKVVAVNAVGQESAGVVVNATPTQPVANSRGDFREESIYFVITSRFNDGDTSNNVACWDDGVAGNNGDPCWRGDFKGLIDKLDYIKALGFSAIWITPVVQNLSGYDYHGYHASNFKKVDPRYVSSGISYQTLIDEVHKRGMKVVQDIVLNHTGNFGEENLYPMFKKDPTKPDTAANILNIAPAGLLPANYSTLLPAAQYQARITAMKEDVKDTQGIYHHEKSLSWESYSVQTGQIAGDAVDLNTENPTVSNYLIDAYNSYIDMGVDSFRVDTVKHISRLTFNKVFNPAFKARGGQNFFMFGEVATRYRQVWNNGIPAVSTPFYTWAESQSYPWSSTNRLTNEASTAQHWNDNISTSNQPSSQNHYLNGNSYRPVNSAIRSGLDVIDFPMHWNFTNARDAFGVALGGDNTYSDATWNVTYVDSHDYAPDTAPENQRFNQPQDVWAENLSLMFSFRGIPTLYYGSEIEFKKGMVIDVGPNKPLEQTGRAYFGNQISGTVNTAGFGKYSGATGNLSSALEYPLAQHIRQLNLIRRAVPALQKGQYSVDGVSGGAMAFKRRFTSNTVDSFALVAVSGDATFSGVPNGTYTDAVTGDVKNVSSGTLVANAAGKGNLRVYVLSTALTSAPGKVVDRAGLTYLK